MKKISIVLLAATVLTACTPPMTWEQQVAIYRQKCMDFGFPPDTYEFAECVRQQDAQANENAQRAADRNNKWQIEQSRQRWVNSKTKKK